MAGRMMKDSGVEWIGTIPNEWKVKRNKELFTEVNERCEKGDDYTLLSVSEYSGVTPRTDVIKDGEFETHAESLDGYKICRAGNIVMNIMLAWKRATAVSRYDGIVSPAYCVYKGNRDVDTRYFHYLFRTDICADMFKQYSTGIIDSRLRLYPDKFLTLYSAVPPLQEQARIADFLDKKVSEIDAVISKTKESIEEYKKLKQSIITEAVTKGLDPNVEMKDSGIEWIGSIPSSWEIQKFKNLGKCRNGLTYSPEDQCGEEGTLVLRSSNIQEGKLSFDDCVYVNKEIPDDLYVKPGDILICSRNGSAKLIGKNAIIPEGLCASFGAFMMIYRSKCPEYLRYILSSSIFSYYLGTFLTVSVNQLTGGNFNNIQFPYTDNPEEQKNIVDYLDKQSSKYDNLISKKEKVITELEQYKKSLIYEYVTGKKEVLS